MRAPPNTENSLVLRTDFSDTAAWDALCTEIQQPVGEFRAYVTCISDPEFDGATVSQLVSLSGEKPDRFFMFVADSETFKSSERTLLVVDLWHEPGRTFRVVPHEVYDIENNLSIANIDFEDFADAADPDGVFRGL